MPKRTIEDVNRYVDCYRSGCRWFKTRPKSEGYERVHDRGLKRIRDEKNKTLNYTRSHLHWDSTDFLINDLLWVLKKNKFDIYRTMLEIKKFKHRGVEVLSHKRTQFILDDGILDSLKMASVLEVQEIETIFTLLDEMKTVSATAEWLNDWIVYLEITFGALRANVILRMPSFLCILERGMAAKDFFEVLSKYVEWYDFLPSTRSEKNALYFIKSKSSDNWIPLLEEFPNSIAIRIAMVRESNFIYKTMSKKMRNTRSIYEAFLDTFGDDREIGMSFLSDELQILIKK